MIVLGVDPGYAIVGCGVLEYQNGRFRTLDAVRSPLRRGFPLKSVLR